MTEYKHTQIGYLMISVALAVVLLCILFFKTVSIQSGSETGPFVAIMAFVIVVLGSFSTLQVSVGDKFVRLKFGYGLFRKKFPLGDIATVRSVKNHWYYGWGIKVWFWPYMWIYNVSGFDAVEIVMKNGQIYRIGTDVPGELESAIRQRVSA